MSADRIIRLGTRGSALARWQTDHVVGLLQAAHPGLRVEIEVITTQGDVVLDKPLPNIGGKGIFTAELETALRSGQIDYAVHSLKDLPTEPPDGLVVGAIPVRANPADVLVSRSSFSLKNLPMGAAVGTSSRRRAAQLLHLRPDLHLLDIRGNVDTRVRKALDEAGDYDAILLAYAGLERLGKLDAVTERLSFEDMLPAPGQGALAIQCRNETASIDLLTPIQHAPTTAAVNAERAFLAGLGGGCSLPIAAYAEIVQERLILRGRVNSSDGKQQIDVSAEGSIGKALDIGYGLAQQALVEGAASLLESVVSLAGKRIVNTRALHQAAEFDALLRDAGAIPLSYPCIAIVPPEDTRPLDAALASDFDLLVLTSANTVLMLAERLKALGLSLNGVRSAAVGVATAQAARDLLGVEIGVIPDDYSAEGLADALTVTPRMRILLPQSMIAGDALFSSLMIRGAAVSRVTAYRTIRGCGGVELAPLLRDKQVDAVTFTSSSTARFFLDRLEIEGATNAELSSVCIASIGRQTGQTLRELGLQVSVEAEKHTLHGLIDGLTTYFGDPL